MDTAPISNLTQFALAGNAIFTVENTVSGNHLTYKVTACDDKPGLFFVGVLTGPENTSDYSYLGTIRAGQYAHGRKSRISEDAQSHKAFSWVWTHKDQLPACVRVHHAGRCCRCGRLLTTVESVTAGIWPECRKKAGVA